MLGQNIGPAVPSIKGKSIFKRRISMSRKWFRYSRALLMLLISATVAISARGDEDDFSVLYRFEPAAPNTGASPLGSQPESRPVLGSDHALYGMTAEGGSNGTGVVYRFDLESHQYTLLHTFSAPDSNGDNSDGAYPGVALTRGPDDVFYGMATSGGQNGNGTIFKITKSGEFTVLHTFSALDANAHNEDGAVPLRTIVVGRNGNLYGTTRIGGENTCGEVPFPNGCGVAWMIDGSGNFHVLHQFTPAEGHAASLLEARDGFFYGCAVWPNTHLPNGQPLPSGTLYRMGAWGGHFEVLYTFSQTNSSGENTDGAECYEPLVETKRGVFYGTTRLGGVNGNGVVFRYSLSNPDAVEVLHDFSATTDGENWDGANPYARLILDHDGAMYSTASNGGKNGNGVVYRITPDGDFHVLHTFSATNPSTGANRDGAVPDFGVIRDWDHFLIGAAALGGRGSSAGLGNSGGTLYRLELK
jgi:uncharacterized repeat protein (TIGR03803 family)